MVRQENFSNPHNGTAAILITPTQYDKRALTCTDPLTLTNSLFNLSYMTSVSTLRIAYVLASDGGLELIVRHLVRLNSNPSTTLSRIAFSAGLTCLSNVAIRGNHMLRRRLVEAGVVPVIIELLTRVVRVLQAMRELERSGVDDVEKGLGGRVGSGSGTTETQQHQRPTAGMAGLNTDRRRAEPLLVPFGTEQTEEDQERLRLNFAQGAEPMDMGLALLAAEETNLELRGMNLMRPMARSPLRRQEQRPQREDTVVNDFGEDYFTTGRRTPGGDVQMETIPRMAEELMGGMAGGLPDFPNPAAGLGGMGMGMGMAGMDTLGMGMGMGMNPINGMMVLETRAEAVIGDRQEDRGVMVASPVPVNVVPIQSPLGFEPGTSDVEGEAESPLTSRRRAGRGHARYYPSRLGASDGMTWQGSADAEEGDQESLSASGSIDTDVVMEDASRYQEQEPETDSTLTPTTAMDVNTEEFVETWATLVRPQLEAGREQLVRSSSLGEGWRREDGPASRPRTPDLMRRFAEERRRTRMEGGGRYEDERGGASASASGTGLTGLTRSSRAIIGDCVTALRRAMSEGSRVGGESSRSGGGMRMAAGMVGVEGGSSGSGETSRRPIAPGQNFEIAREVLSSPSAVRAMPRNMYLSPTPIRPPLPPSRSTQNNIPLPARPRSQPTQPPIQPTQATPPPTTTPLPPPPPAATAHPVSTTPLPPHTHYRVDDILLSIKLIAYLSKYPHLRTDLHTKWSQNVFELVEQFTVPGGWSEVRKWAVICMRNAFKRDGSSPAATSTADPNMMESNSNDGNGAEEVRSEAGKEKPLRRCGYLKCGKMESHPREFSKCSRCRRVTYCCKGCQKTAWRLHKNWCLKCEEAK